MGEIEDPAGHNYKVHKGPLITNAAPLEEESKAMMKFGDMTMDLKQVRIRQSTLIHRSNVGRHVCKKLC